MGVEIDLNLPIPAAPHAPWHHFHAFGCWHCGEGEAVEAEGVETDGKHLPSAQGAYLHHFGPPVLSSWLFPSAPSLVRVLPSPGVSSSFSCA